MRVIPTTYSLHYFWQHLVFTEAALLANPETAAFAAPVTALLDDYDRHRGHDLATQRAVIQAVGIPNVLTKNIGSRNPHNAVKATINALEQLRAADAVAEARGVAVEKL